MGRPHTQESKELMRVAATRRWAADPRRLPERICSGCGTSFKATRQTNGRQQYCNRACWKGDAALGDRHHKWNAEGRGLRSSSRSGQKYYCIRHAGRWRLEHIVKAEAVLGRPLNKGEVVHHIDGNGLNNTNSNLLICTQAYHAALHQRMADLWMKEHFRGGN